MSEILTDLTFVLVANLVANEAGSASDIDWDRLFADF